MKITIKAARVNAGLTQEKAAKLARISRNTLITWENGSVNPSYANLRLLSSIYGCTVNDFSLPKNLTNS